MSVEKNKIITRNLEHQTTNQDSVLKWLISLVENGENPINITLNVKGTILSGSLISRKEYFEKLSQNLTKTSRSINAHYLSQEEGFIHLNKARIHYSSMDTAPLDQEILWRGKLSSIDGFHVGLFSSYP